MTPHLIAVQPQHVADLDYAELDDVEGNSRLEIR